jgi:hypothetical protein
MASYDRISEGPDVEDDVVDSTGGDD